MTLGHSAVSQCTVWITAHEAPGPKAPTPLILCWRCSWLRLCQFLFPGPSCGPEGAQYMQMWEGSRSGSLPSRSSMAPASMMSSSSSSSGPSSSWGWAELPDLRGRPFLPAAAAGGGPARGLGCRPALSPSAALALCLLGPGKGHGDDGSGGGRKKKRQRVTKLCAGVGSILFFQLTCHASLTASPDLWHGLPSPARTQESCAAWWCPSAFCPAVCLTRWPPPGCL